METLKAIAMRTSTRNFKQDQVTENELNTVLNAGCAAPVGMGAYDDVRLTVIQNADLLNRINAGTAKAYANSSIKASYNAPTLIVVSAKQSRVANGEVANVACVTENMHLAATDIGLGSVYLLGFVAAFSADESLLQELDLPEGFLPLAGLAVGYPVEPLTKVRELTQKISIDRI